MAVAVEVVVVAAEVAARAARAAVAVAVAVVAVEATNDSETRGAARKRSLIEYTRLCVRVRERSVGLRV